MPNLAKYKIAASDQIVHRTKKIIKQKSSGLMSLWRSTSTSGVSDQIYGCYGQKTDFSCFLNFRAPNILIRFELLLRCSLIFFLKISVWTHPPCLEVPLGCVSPSPMVLVPPKRLPKVGGTLSPPPITWKCSLHPSLIGLSKQHFTNSIFHTTVRRFLSTMMMDNLNISHVKMDQLSLKQLITFKWWIKE